MSKIYDKQLVYIPSDLVGNAVVDKLRKSQNLQTPPAGSAKSTLIANLTNNATFDFKESETTSTTKKYTFQVAVDDVLFEGSKSNFLEKLKFGAANPQKFHDGRLA